MDQLEGGFTRNGSGKTDTLESVLVLEPEALLKGTGGRFETHGSLSAFSQAKDINACVVKRFVQGRATCNVLLQWASQICSHGKLVTDELQYWEGYEAHDGEAFSDQLQRQLSEDFEHMSQVLVDEGVDAVEAERLNDPEGQLLLVQLIEELKTMYLAAYENPDNSSKQKFWHVKLDINAHYPCMNFWLAMDELHDDPVTLRLVSALVGDGTVVTSSDVVNWEVYYGGPPVQEKINEWNLRVAARDVPTDSGDVLLMKGGESSAKYPCLHRTPYSSADVGNARLLVTAELVDADQMADLINRFCDTGSDASDVGEIADADAATAASSGTGEPSGKTAMIFKALGGAGEGGARSKSQPRVH
jgi:hypothetical protein